MDIEPLKIGILLTRPKAEFKKDELCNIKSNNRPWLKNIFDSKIHKKLSIKNRKGQQCVPGDVSIGMYILDNWNNVEVDFITPEDINPKRLRDNHINFMVIYDLLESFHVDDKKIYENFVKTLAHADNIYPPYNYQKFINNKCSYIKHLSKVDENLVIPTHCITMTNWKRIGTKNCRKLIQRIVKEREWGRFIAKPVFGQESIDFKNFGYGKNDTQIDKYIDMCFKTKKYPGIIFQKYIEGFDKTKPEIRMYYIGNQYKYSVITNDKTVKIPRDEQGTADVPNKNGLKSFTKKVVNDLPGIEIQGVTLPRLLTRVDVACEHKFAKPWIVNEVEFVPSLYIEDINIIPEPDLGDQMVNIGLELVKKSKNYQYIKNSKIQ